MLIKPLGLSFDVLGWVITVCMSLLFSNNYSESQRVVYSLYNCMSDTQIDLQLGTTG